VNGVSRRYDAGGRELLGQHQQPSSLDHAAIDQEIERLRPLVDLGGYSPCPDHRLPIEAKWENVRYFCEAMRKHFA
jgi:hypothetical protein